MNGVKAITPPRPGILSLLFERDRALAIVGLSMLALAVPTAILMVVDPRTIGGVSVFLKPLKFQLSLAAFLLTLCIFMGHVEEAARRGVLAATARWTAISTGIFEVAYITFRGARAEPSHFNDTTAFAELMFSVMGLAAIALTATAGLVAVLVLRRGRPEARFVSVRGYVVAGLMVTAVLGIFTGGAIGANNGYAVGLAAAGAGDETGWVPLFGWLRDAGDLRVAHFFALHAMQVIPLAGAFVVATAPKLRRSTLVAGTVAYSALTVAVLVQALTGEPFLPALQV